MFFNLTRPVVKLEPSPRSVVYWFSGKSPRIRQKRYVCVCMRCVSATHYGVVVKSRPSSLSTVQYCDLSSCMHCVVFCVLFQDITALFASDKCPNYSSCEFADNDCWYITFDSEEDTQKVRVHVWCVHVVCTLFLWLWKWNLSICVVCADTSLFKVAAYDILIRGVSSFRYCLLI